MFQVGDRILYPMHGACSIEAIVKFEMLGENKVGYLLNIPQLKMQVTVLTDKAIKLGIREIVEPEIIENVLCGFNIGDTDPVIFENQRICRDVNKEKIKSGDIYKGTEVIRDLTRKGKRAKLGADDINMLNNARQIFVSELMEVKGLSQEQAVHLLDEALSCS